MKTTEQAAIEFNNSKYGHHPQCWVTAIFEAAKTFAEEWISVEDELPERYTDVIAKCGNTLWIAQLQPHGKGLTLYSVRNPRGIEEFEATHWRPINKK